MQVLGLFGYRVRLVAAPEDGQRFPFSPAACFRWAVTISAGDHSETFDYYTGSALPDEPSLADVLYSLSGDAEAVDQDFGEWAHEFGLGDDPRQAWQTYQACRRNGERILRLVGRLPLAVARAAEDTDDETDDAEGVSP